MSRSTPTGPWNVGRRIRKHLSNLTTPAGVAPIGTVKMVQTSTVAYTTVTTANVINALVMPRHSKILGITVQSTVPGTNVQVAAGLTLGGSEVMAGVTPVVNTSVARTITPAGVVALSNPAVDTPLYISVAAVAAASGSVTVAVEYIMFADATQTIEKFVG